MMLGKINQIIPFSAVDGPGNRVAIFLQGCNFDCVYCHNPETINHCNHCGRCTLVCPSEALVHDGNTVKWQIAACTGCDACTKACSRNSSPKIQELTAMQLVEQITPYLAFAQGVTVSGGECTLQEKFILEFFSHIKALGLSCFIDTNGSLPLWQMPELMKLTDGVMLDVKSWDKELHLTYIGKTNQVVKNNLEYLIKEQKLYEVRTVIVPELLDPKDTVDAVSKHIGKAKQSIRYKLIRYRELGVRHNPYEMKIPSEQQMKELVAICETNGCKDVLVV